MAENAKSTDKSDGDAEKVRVTIKKYANRRLYNTQTSSYVTLDHLAQMVKDGTDFAVFDAKSGEDITRSVLTHIIVEEEGKGQSLLPIDFLRHLISFYGDSLQSVVPNYLDASMHNFARNQEQMRGVMKEALGGISPLGPFEEMGKQNLAMFENAMKMFTPFYPNGSTGPNGSAGPNGTGGPEAPKAATADEGASAEDLETLKSQLEQMQSQLNRLSGGKS